MTRLLYIYYTTTGDDFATLGADHLQPDTIIILNTWALSSEGVMHYLTPLFAKY